MTLFGPGVKGITAANATKANSSCCDDMAQAVSHPLRPASDRGNTGSGHLDQTERTHQLDELIDFAAVAGDLENEALGGGIDHPGTEGIGEPPRLDTMIAGAVHLDHRA